MHTAWFWYTPEGVWHTGLQNFSRKNFPEAGMLNCGVSHVFNIY